MLRCCVFKNSKNLPTSDSQLKVIWYNQHIIYTKLFHVFEIYSATKFHNNPWKDQSGQNQGENPSQRWWWWSIWSENVPWRRKYVCFFNSALVLFKPGLCSDNKLTELCLHIKSKTKFCFYIIIPKLIHYYLT